MQGSAGTYAAHQRARFMQSDAARWMRPDAERWIRSDIARFLAPGTDPASIFPALDCKYSPSQPRVPAGNSDGGQWTNGGPSARWAVNPTDVDDRQDVQRAADVQLAQVGSSVTDADGLPYYATGGHHEMPRGVYTKWELRPETERVFNRSTTGSLATGTRIETDQGLLRGHYWDGPNGAHARYNNAVQELSERFMSENRLTSEMMTPDHARQLLTRIRDSDIPEIRDYNRAIRMLRRIFRLGRGRE
ncbi:hypothetical protein NP284_14665 [Rhodopseudomonas pseudopalustris]|uniref:Uncharacterized protein n=2 Tax=Rhodopseudomonas pseudopalustris TaxID=1513892 RepID=A0A1H8S4Y3_9BRAD|nr:hypothetical protein SAMN05444123_104249 [Rhodopseudomonas pseudopalustris]